MVQAETHPGPPKVFALLIRSDDELLVGSIGRGLRVSSNRTRDWSAPERGGFGVNTLVGGSDGRLLAGTVSHGVMSSPDGGRQWTTLGDGLDGTTVHAVLPCATGLLAGTDGHGIAWLATDENEWQRLDGGLPSTIYRLVSVDGTVLAATLEHGVMPVAVPGQPHESWTALTDETVHALLFLGPCVFAGTSGAGLCRSHDGGRTWQSVAPDVIDPVVHCLDGRGTTLVAGTATGVFVSRDGGYTWSSNSDGLASRRIFSVAVARDGRLFAGGYDGVWTSPDIGSRWQRVATGLTAPEIYAVSVEPDGSSWAGGFGRLWLSCDGGSTWSADEDGLEGRTVHGIATPPGGWRYLATDDGVLVQQPGGGWTSIGLEGCCVLAVAADGDRLYAATLGDGFMTSSDRGDSWVRAEGFTCPTATDVCVTSAGVVVTGLDARSGSKTGGVFRVDERDGRCHRLDVPPLAAYRIAEAPDGQLYVGAQRSTILRSDDAGVSWHSLATTGLVDCKLYALAASSDGCVYIGTDGGVLVSDDGAASWRRCVEHATDSTPYSLAITPGGDVICGTSQGVRVWADHDRTARRAPG